MDATLEIGVFGERARSVSPSTATQLATGARGGRGQGSAVRVRVDTRLGQLLGCATDVQPSRLWKFPATIAAELGISEAELEERLTSNMQKGLAKGTPERQRIVAIDEAIAAHKAKKA